MPPSVALICPELGVAPRIDPGTDLEDELSTRADSPAVADHGVAPLSAPADVDIGLEQVFGDVGSLPAMVTPVCDIDGLIVVQPPMVTSPAGPTVVSSGFLQPLTGSVGCSLVPPMIPAVSTPDKSLLLKAAEKTQGQPWAGPSFGGWGIRRVAISLRLPWSLVRRLRLIKLVNRTQLGSTRTSMTCLVRGSLISTRITSTPAPRHVCCRAPRGVHSG